MNMSIRISKIPRLLSRGRLCHNHGYSVRLQDYHVIDLQRSCSEMAKELKLLRQEIRELKETIIPAYMSKEELSKRLNMGNTIETKIEQFQKNSTIPKVV